MVDGVEGVAEEAGEEVLAEEEEEEVEVVGEVVDTREEAVVVEEAYTQKPNQLALQEVQR